MLAERDDQALYRAVLANPADDAPRYLYADAVREAGADQLADFIEWQLKHPRCSFTGWLVSKADYDQADRERTEVDPLNASATIFGSIEPQSWWWSAEARTHWEWFEGFARATVLEHSPFGWKWTWRRGFVFGISGLDAGAAYDHLKGWRAKFPIQRALVRGTLNVERRRELMLHCPGAGKTEIGRLSLYTGVLCSQEPRTAPAGYRMPLGFQTSTGRPRRPDVSIWETVPADAEDD